MVDVASPTLLNLPRKLSMMIDHSRSGSTWSADIVARLLAEGVDGSEIEIWDGTDEVVVMVRGDIRYRWTAGGQVLPEVETFRFARAS
jgi:hypothetical protein